MKILFKKLCHWLYWLFRRPNQNGRYYSKKYLKKALKEFNERGGELTHPKDIK